ncbi:MAG: alpha/beta hydrolase fold domain-containing protein, partial [bacterium]
MATPQAEPATAELKLLDETALGVGLSPTLEQQRAGLDFVIELATLPEGVTVTETYAGGCRAYWQDPAGAATDRVILYFHGGGYMGGSPRTHERLVGHMAKATGCRALSVDYRLAPEHPHPAAVTDATNAYRWLLAQGYKPEHIAISGDSAGGGLT